MVKAMILKVKDGNLIATFNEFFSSLLQKKIVDFLLVPQELKGSVIQTLVKDVSQLKSANPAAPLLLTNSARLVSNLTAWNPEKKIGVVLRSCEIRALIELVKLKQASLERLIIIGVDCLGTYEAKDYKEKKGELRIACQTCEYPAPENTQMTLSLIGFDTQKEIGIIATLEIAEKLGLEEEDIGEGREAALSKLREERLKKKDEFFSEYKKRFGNLKGLLAEFAACRRCYNCRRECPICYCRECIFDTPTFEYKSEHYLRWAERKGILRMPVEILLYHLTRLNHMVTSCIGCGQCQSACPNDLPVYGLFQMVGQKVQQIFEYVPGRNPEEEMPLTTFKEEELEPR